jgi:hypothetical protein
MSTPACVRPPDRGAPNVSVKLVPGAGQAWSAWPETVPMLPLPPLAGMAGMGVLASLRLRRGGHGELQSVGMTDDGGHSGAFCNTAWVDPGGHATVTEPGTGKLLVGDAGESDLCADQMIELTKQVCVADWNGCDPRPFVTVPEVHNTYQYTIRAENKWDQVVYLCFLFDVLPEGLTYDSGSWHSPVGQAHRCLVLGRARVPRVQRSAAVGRHRRGHRRRDGPARPRRRIRTSRRRRRPGSRERRSAERREETSHRHSMGRKGGFPAGMYALDPRRAACEDEYSHSGIPRS